jgi:primosomal replication protein N
MPSTTNCLEIKGTVNKLPRIDTTKNGKIVCSFSMTVKSGMNGKQTDYFRVSVWGEDAKEVYQHIEIGTRLRVKGSVHLNKFGKGLATLACNAFDGGVTIGDETGEEDSGELSDDFGEQ